MPQDRKSDISDFDDDIDFDEALCMVSQSDKDSGSKLSTISGKKSNDASNLLTPNQIEFIKQNDTVTDSGKGYNISPEGIKS